MKASYIAAAAVVAAVAVAACSSDNNNTGYVGGQGGSSGYAGSAGSGGSRSADAGTAGSGGTAGKGGSSGSAGSGGFGGSKADAGVDSGADAAVDSGADSSVDSGADAGSDGAVAATFTEVYSSVISQKCTPCHTSAGGIGITNGHLDMTSKALAYSNLVNAQAAGVACNGKGPRVVPGSPDQSVMYLKVSLDDPSPCGAKMPFGLPPLSQDEVSKIESWINAGAPNN